jgi:hypothetical protein
MRRILIIATTLTLIAGCYLVDSPEPLPCYIRVDQLVLNTEYTKEGANTQGFKDVWVFVDGSSIGAYELPAVIPILSENSTAELSFQAGIRVNGTLLSPSYYPFTTTYKSSISLSPLDTIIITPEFEYVSSVQVAYKEDFETVHDFTIDVDGDTDSALKIFSDDPGAGLSCAYFELAGDTLMEVGSSYLIENFPTNGSPIYLELDYRNNVIFDIELIGYDINSQDKYPFLAINPRENWNRIYIDLTSILIQSQFSAYRVVIGVSNIGHEGTAEVFVDNVKVLYFN